MAKIPLFQQNVQQTAETGATFAPSGAAPFRAVQQLGGVVAGIGFDFADRMNKEETEAQTAGYIADRKMRSNAAEAQLAVMQDPDKIEEFYAKWRSDEEGILTDSKLTNDARRAITNNYEDFYATSDIKASGYHRKAKIKQFDRGYIDSQGLALNNESDPTLVNPKTSQPYTPAELYEYATMKRVDLGTVDYEDAVGDIRNFGQNLDYRRIVTVSDNNPDKAKEILNESSLTGEKLILASDAVRDGMERRDKMIETSQRSSTTSVNKEVQGKTLSRQQLEKYSKETKVVMGKEIPILPPEVVNANRQYLDAQELYDKATQKKRIPEINKLIKNVITEGRSDVGEKETDKMYTSIAKLAQSGAAKVTVESMLNTANNASESYAKGRGWNKGTSDMMYDITDAYTTLYAEGDFKYKNADQIAAILEKTNDFIKFAEDSGGNPSEDALIEWRKNNMGELDKDMAINKYSNQYRVGERKITEKGPRIYKGGGVFEIEVD